MLDFRSLRVGQGFDAHRFAPEAGEPLALCCLSWPGETPLEGHSDGDVAAHALCDALLSAGGLGDLGSNFGTSRPEFAGAGGEVFLGEVRRMLAEAGWVPINATVQVVGCRPRMASRYAEASSRLSELVGAPVSVSATTTDSMGWTGRGEGLAAIATCLLYRESAPADC